MTKKALLDTDFLFKTHLSQNLRQESLADAVMEFDGYEFFCHEKILDELKAHGFDPDPIPWLENKFDSGKIIRYSDKRILDDLEKMFGPGAPGMYFDMLKRSCDAFKGSLFPTYYQRLIDLPDKVGTDDFLSALADCDSKIPSRNSMGENKSFVLAQLLQLKYPGKVVVLCSDDSGARQRVGYIDGKIKCLSVLAIFQKMMQDGFARETARQYYDSLCSFYSLRGQRAMKVWKHSTSERISVDFLHLFEDISAGKFEIKGSGDLRYKE